MILRKTELDPREINKHSTFSIIIPLSSVLQREGDLLLYFLGEEIISVSLKINHEKRIKVKGVSLSLKSR